MLPDKDVTPNPVYCSDYSLASGEPLIGTATQTDGYILVECNEGWGEKALEESQQIPQPVKDLLKRYTKAHPTVKVLLVRAARPYVSPGLRCFIASTTPERQALYAFQIAAYEALLDLDFSAVLSGDPAYQANRLAAPMFLVCTNGRRDFCCARHGVAALNTLVSLTQEYPDLPVWHSTHLGGHRFAANLLCLPSGLLYGRVGMEQAGDILQACLQEQVYLPNLRGRTCYPPAVQAADYYIRIRTGLMSLSALRWDETTEIAPEEWQVRFFSPVTQETYQVRVRVSQTKTMVFDSCRLDKVTPVVTYEFI